MRCFLPLAILFVAAAFAGARSAPPAAKEIRALVSQLGSDEYADREAAAKQLEELGEAAVAELRAGCKSESPEIARRSQDILRKVERRLQNAKTLAPTLVELDVKDQTLDDVLADLSKQAKCEVVLNGVKVEQLAHKKITVTTNGKVPFWEAVLKVCDAADAQIAIVGGFLAPDAMPYRSTARYPVEKAIHIFPENPKFRIAKNAQQAVVLEARSGAKRRPAGLYGAVLVEAVDFPKGSEPSEPSVLLQAWPEPRLQWQMTSSVKVTTATDFVGKKLTIEPGVVARQQVVPSSREELVILRNADGSATLMRGGGLQVAGPFAPNVRQAVVRFKADEKSPDVVKELGVSLFAAARSGFEPLTQASGLELNRPSTGVGVPGIELTAVYNKAENGRLTATVTLSYDPLTVNPAGMGDELQGAKDGAGPGNQTVYGLRVTDANGRPFALGLATGRHGFEAGNARVAIQATLELHANKLGPPTAVTFWGSYARQIEVPVTLKDVLFSRKK